ncbi:hypothetical protein AU210_004425 [Fusarium oxysporum f. sp. radicis-cucumerinum]|uniref:Epidermal growth factor receptor-like transmembrane-juxtamembrane segment domain-containing protein n=1 Tax=Fusarium oxysporum f. sp. radicis-cucumerinum TaxID=327505 RepID=A0A2H3HQE9_FUSOX|nr:hypothetical protein AU210_004425 [Fusarium oxysporum f. sp. radicis-cucumerinum]
MLALRTRALFNFIFGRQYAGIPREIDTNNTHSLEERAPVVITKTKMESRYVVIPEPTTIVVTYHVPTNATENTDSVELPPASTAPAADLTSVPAADPAVDTPVFASLIVPTTQEAEPVPTTVPEAGGEAAPETSDANLNETTVPIEPIAHPTSQPPPQETPQEPPVVNGPDPVTIPVQPTTEELPKGTPEDARLTDGPDPVTTPVQTTTPPAPQETPQDARLIDGPDPVLLFDTASFTFTGPPSRSTTLQTRSVTRTASSATETTEASDSFVFDDGETGADGAAPALSTASLADGGLTTIGLGATAGSDHASKTESPDSAVKKDSDNAGPTPVVVGSIVGSIVGLSFLALVIFWLIRRRRQQRRRSTLLTPLDFPQGGSGKEKYEIDNHSLGPTPRSVKVAAAMSANAKKIGQRFRQSMSSSHVDMSRGNSQFGAESHSASTNRAPSRGSAAPGQQQGWWSRLIEESSVVDLAAAPPVPDDGYDGRRTPSPNPFSDANTIRAAPRGDSYGHGSVLPHGSLVPPPLAPARPHSLDNPFADESSSLSPDPMQPPPMAYREPVDQRQGPTMSRNLTPQSTGDGVRLRPQEVWRGNVHSNPFDLELDGRHMSSMGHIQNMPRYTAASSFYSTNRQTVRHSRAESYTSRYTSGVSDVSEWPPVPPQPRVPSIYGRYDGSDFPPSPRHSRSESDGNILRRQTGQAM